MNLEYPTKEYENYFIFNTLCKMTADKKEFPLERFKLKENISKNLKDINHKEEKISNFFNEGWYELLILFDCLVKEKPIQLKPTDKNINNLIFQIDLYFYHFKDKIDFNLILDYVVYVSKIIENSSIHDLESGKYIDDFKRLFVTFLSNIQDLELEDKFIKSDIKEENRIYFQNLIDGLLPKTAFVVVSLTNFLPLIKINHLLNSKTPSDLFSIEDKTHIKSINEVLLENVSMGFAPKQIYLSIFNKGELKIIINDSKNKQKLSTALLYEIQNLRIIKTIEEVVPLKPESLEERKKEEFYYFRNKFLDKYFILNNYEKEYFKKNYKEDKSFKNLMDSFFQDKEVLKHLCFGDYFENIKLENISNENKELLIKLETFKQNINDLTKVKLKQINTPNIKKLRF